MMGGNRFVIHKPIKQQGFWELLPSLHTAQFHSLELNCITVTFSIKSYALEPMKYCQKSGEN
jgi:hypothetical protein